MLDDSLKTQLQQYLGLLRQPIRLIASLDDSETGTDMKALLETIVSLSDKVTLDTSGNDARKPSFVVAREGETQGVRFAGLPLATSSPRWCWPCSGPAATRPRWSRT